MAIYEVIVYFLNWKHYIAWTDKHACTENIMNTLTEDGFEVKDVFYYLYTRLTAEV